MSADLIQHLRFHGRYGSETEDQAKLRRVQRNEAAATELERLTAELAAARADAERFHWLREWLVRNGQLLCVECQPTAGAKVGPYWVFRRAYMVDGTSLER